MNDHKERLLALLRANPLMGRARAAKELGCTEKRVRTLRKQLEKEGLLPPNPNGFQPKQAETEQTAAPKEGFTFEEQSSGHACATSVSRDIRTLEDLLAYAQVDTKVWEVERYVVNRWSMGFKDADKQAQSLPLYQIKAWLKKRIVVEQTRQLITEMLSAFKEQAPELPVIKYPKHKDGVLLEVSIFDLHLGKLVWKPECGNNYDSKIAQEGFRDALGDLLARASGFNVERIVFPVGNDALNSDNSAGTTTAGTQQAQREDGRWQKLFVSARKLMVEAILRMRQVAPVDVVMIPGNHDRERVFYLGDTLAGWLSRTPGVTVDNAPTMRKYYQFGRNLIGFTHGNEEKLLNLPLIMATEQPAMWAATRFREFHAGHWHHKKDIHFQPVNEFNGIRVRLIPSLCPSDDWHRMKGYEGLRAAELYVWDKNDGCVGTFSYTPPAELPEAA